MPIWKFGPESAKTKITYQPIVISVAGLVAGICKIVPIGMAGRIDISGNDPVRLDQFSGEQFASPITFVQCKLTMADGLSDLELPIRYFSAQMDAEGKERISVTIPSMNDAEGIADRANGLLALTKICQGAGNARTRDEFARAPIQSIRVYDGSKNQSIVLEAVK